MCGVVDVPFCSWCGGCLVWSMSYFTHGVVNVWCGGCLVWWMSYNRQWSWTLSRGKQEMWEEIRARVNSKRGLGVWEFEEWEETRGGANWRQLITGCWQAANHCKPATAAHHQPQHQASKAKWPPSVQTRGQTIKWGQHRRSKMANKNQVSRVDN